jgi:hypothetical protein
MTDLKLFTHKRVTSDKISCSLREGVSDQMDAHYTFTTGQSPDMQIVHIFDPSIP